MNDAANETTTDPRWTSPNQADRDAAYRDWQRACLVMDAPRLLAQIAGYILPGGEVRTTGYCRIRDWAHLYCTDPTTVMRVLGIR